MNDDVKLVITSTFGVIVLAWVILNATNVNQITGGAADAYSKAVGALKPTG